MTDDKYTQEIRDRMCALGGHILAMNRGRTFCLRCDVDLDINDPALAGLVTETDEGE